MVGEFRLDCHRESTRLLEQLRCQRRGTVRMLLSRLPSAKLETSFGQSVWLTRQSVAFGHPARSPVAKYCRLFGGSRKADYISVGQTVHLNDPGSEDFRALA